jgi:UPF0755 protein
MRSLLKIVGFFILVVAAWLAWALLLPVHPRGQVFVLLRPGYSTRHIAGELKSAGVIRNEHAFLLWHYIVKPRTLKAGEYLFDQPTDALQVHRRLVRGDVYVHTVVIPEGFNIFDIAQAIEAAGLGSRQDFLTAARTDTTLVSDIDPQAHSLEGYLFPDTYHFTRTQTMQDMISAMIHRFRQEARNAGLLADPAPGTNPTGRTPETAPDSSGQNVHQAVTMASIVEKETSVPEERPLVASVYYNRLQKNIALDADPCVIYAALLQGSYDGALHHADLSLASPYNTYKYSGLPPGPIANPGTAALTAALHPANTGYFYFVSDGSGHHRFATSLEEHNRNVAALRRALAARGNPPQSH